MLFYVILSLLAFSGIMLVFVRHFRQSSASQKDFVQIFKDQLGKWKQARALKQVSTHKEKTKHRVRKGAGFFEDSTGLVREELWQQKSVADICLMVEEALKQKEPKRALEFLNFLADKYHEREVQEYLYSLLVMAHEQTGDAKSALHYCNKLLEMSPGDTACMLKIAEFYIQEAEHRQAEELLLRLIEMEKSNLKALDLLAEIYAKTFRLREAEELKRKVVALRMTKKS